MSLSRRRHRKQGALITHSSIEKSFLEGARHEPIACAADTETFEAEKRPTRLGLLTKVIVGGIDYLITELGKVVLVLNQATSPVVGGRMS